MDYTQKIIKLAKVQNPVNSPTSGHWDSIETELNIKFPEDYKDLVTRLGDGRFGDGLALKNPHPQSLYKFDADAIRFFRKQRLPPRMLRKIKIFPEKDGWLYLTSIELTYLLLKPDIKHQGAFANVACYFSDADDSIIDLGVQISEFIYRLYEGEYQSELLTELTEANWDGRAFFTPLGTKRTHPGPRESKPWPFNQLEE
jgi:hypothetical protein